MYHKFKIGIWHDLTLFTKESLIHNCMAGMYVSKVDLQDHTSIRTMKDYIAIHSCSIFYVASYILIKSFQCIFYNSVT